MGARRPAARRLRSSALAAGRAHSYRVGRLRAAPGQRPWSNSSGSPRRSSSYRWFRSGVAIPGATQAKYTLTAADYGKVIKLAVTGTKTGYGAVTKYSAGTRAVAPGVFRNVTPTIAGSAKVGQTLTANPGNWGVSGVTFTYKWYRNGATISGATQASYRLTSADKGKKITVKVTGKASRYYTATKTSRATAKVS